MEEEKPSALYFHALSESQAHHLSNKTYSGSFLRPHKPFIKEIIDRLGIRSILDYGCGKGRQYEWIDPADGLTLEQFWGVEVARYDPAYPPYAAEPVGTFDLVLCTHTLGSIPTQDLPWAIRRLYRLANKAIYVSEKIGPAKKQVFAKTDVMPHGWTEKQWRDVIAAQHRSGIEVHVTTLLKSPPDEDGRVEKTMNRMMLHP